MQLLEEQVLGREVRPGDDKGRWDLVLAAPRLAPFSRFEPVVGNVPDGGRIVGEVLDFIQRRLVCVPQFPLFRR